MYYNIRIYCWKNNITCVLKAASYDEAIEKALNSFRKTIESLGGLMFPQGDSAIAWLGTKKDIRI